MEKCCKLLNYVIELSLNLSFYSLSTFFLPWKSKKHEEITFKVLAGKYSYSGQKHLIKIVCNENTWNPHTTALYLTLNGEGWKAGVMSVLLPCLEQKKKGAP